MSGNKKNNSNTRKPFLRQSRSGQVLIESLLLMVLSLGFLDLTLKYFKDAQTFNKITNVMWSGVAQMAEYGSWPGMPAQHPNDSERMRTLK